MNEEPQASDEAGFGMIEVVVSMFMIMLLAVAFLPVLISGMKTTATNATVATATQLVNQSIESARSTTYTNCAGMNALTGTTTAPDGRGGTLQITRTVTCNATQADPERITVVVVNAAKPLVELARAVTFVRLA